MPGFDTAGGSIGRGAGCCNLFTGVGCCIRIAVGTCLAMVAGVLLGLGFTATCGVVCTGIKWPPDLKTGSAKAGGGRETLLIGRCGLAEEVATRN